MSGTVRDVIYTIQFGDLSNAELDQVSQAIQYRRSQLAKSIKRSLNTGDAVKFYSHRAGYTVTGTVKKVAIKYVTVSTNQGLWRVPANMLEAA